MMKKTGYLSMVFVFAICGTLFAKPVQKPQLNEKATQKIVTILKEIGYEQNARQLLLLCNDLLPKTGSSEGNAQSVSIPYMHESLRLYWETSKWIPDVKQLHLYDANDLNTEVYAWEWDNTQWVKASLMVMTYNAQNDPVLVLMKMWEESTGTWEDFAKIEVSYNTYGDPVEFLIKVNFSGMWMDLMKMVYSYNAQNKVSEILTQSYDMFSTVWENTTLESYSYNTAGEIDEVIEQDWDSTGWENTNKINYLYNSNNDISESFTMFWAGSWMHYQRATYVYDSQGNLTNLLEEIWDNTTYVNDYQRLMTYDAQSRVVVELMQFWDNGVWENDQQVVWTYDQPVGIDSKGLVVMESVVYPNPSTNRVSISLDVPVSVSLSGIVLYDVAGRIVKQQFTGDLHEGHHILSLSLENISSGNYILTLQGNGQVLLREKLMVTGE